MFPCLIIRLFAYFKNGNYIHLHTKSSNQLESDPFDLTAALDADPECEFVCLEGLLTLQFPGMLSCS